MVPRGACGGRAACARGSGRGCFIEPLMLFGLFQNANERPHEALDMKCPAEIYASGTICYLCVRAGPQSLWSGRWESNPRPKLGKLLYCHCTTPARVPSLYLLYEGETTRTPSASRPLAVARLAAKPLPSSTLV